MDWTEFDLSASNLSKEELEYYNSGGTVEADRYGREKRFPRKGGRWQQHEWTADIEPLPPFDPVDFIRLVECDKEQQK